MSFQEPSLPVRKIVRIAAKPGLADAMRAALRELELATKAEPGCREFRFFQALTEPDAFLLIEDFTSAEALEGHMRQPHTRAFFARNLAASIAAIERGWLS
ncbi:MAG TPA: putative quinol monooxygenase [Alphaproteobacteria bacterium]|nr:putative quinol monooxygenase [Alphaproteobacteria bacterium]